MRRALEPGVGEPATKLWELSDNRSFVDAASPNRRTRPIKLDDANQNQPTGVGTCFAYR
jgi:hypothetical protein